MTNLLYPVSPLHEVTGCEIRRYLRSQQASGLQWRRHVTACHNLLLLHRPFLSLKWRRALAAREATGRQLDLSVPQVAESSSS
ncbi:hypothetical protein RRG08_011256 [Elysia crispata]|uniref:Uncharacterized protein n=1 Tax=Elysia crispata TaxID=231223 RepID=A0AAE0YQ36_9GAST|nr:hypothetical protein RRG08_011256 [Elysia crispata]